MFRKNDFIVLDKVRLRDSAEKPTEQDISVVSHLIMEVFYLLRIRSGKSMPVISRVLCEFCLVSWTNDETFKIPYIFKRLGISLTRSFDPESAKAEQELVNKLNAYFISVVQECVQAGLLTMSFSEGQFLYCPTNEAINAYTEALASVSNVN